MSHATLDGNEAVARVAHALSEVVAVYPITPASPMGEHADEWSRQGLTNLWGTVPEVIEMQSEGGAAGALHGALQAGALATTFTASQGLLLMIPNLFKIAGELTPAVIHVAARTVATHALSIFGDHSDVMAARGTGWAMLCAASVQEAQDLAAIAHAATLETRVPFLHFFDGFRTSHEVAKIELLEEADLRRLIDEDSVLRHRERALDPERPVLRGSAQNPDVFFQAREASNPFHDAVPAAVQGVMGRFATISGREYGLCELVGDPAAQRVIVAMGSACGAIEEAVERRVAAGEPVALVKLRLFRPFPTDAVLDCLPAEARSIAVLDRTKEPGSVGEPLWQDVAAAVLEGWSDHHATPLPRVLGGRYGLSSKELTPAMAEAVFEELRRDPAKRHFSLGIRDDVTRLSLDWDEDSCPEDEDVLRAVFFGLGSDGTVGAAKNTAKIIGESTELNVQGYFVYDSKKSGSMTVSHLRFSPRPIRSTYLIRQAQYVGIHQFHFLERLEMLNLAAPGATVLLNSPWSADDVWDRLPLEVQREALTKHLRLFVVDADRVAREAGLGGRINTVMQTCFFSLSGLLHRDDALDHIRDAARRTYSKSGTTVLERNLAAIDSALDTLAPVELPSAALGSRHIRPVVPPTAPDFVQRITARMLEGKGDLLPVSALPVDGTFPTSTSRWEKRSIAHEIPIWDPEICIECGLCALVCPHAAIRMKVFDPAALADAPASFAVRPWSGRELLETGDPPTLTIQVLPDDCTGCAVCVDVCPARSKEVARHRALNMEAKEAHLERERANLEFFLSAPELEARRVDTDSVKGSQLLEPLFESSGACAGCGETPYLKLLSQLFGDRAVIANATGCSSIYGGNLPTTPWASNAAGRGPAWANSLFEDNAEFGLGIRLAIDGRQRLAQSRLESLSDELGENLVRPLLREPGRDAQAVAERREQVEALRRRCREVASPEALLLAATADDLVPRSVWIVGGDGWAYDIGFGGLDHAIASHRNINILVLDTEVYSNTGGQASKSTPRAAVAKYAAGGKAIRKKDLGMIAMAYGNVYVAQISIGANPRQTIRALHEAESYDGPSLVLAYSTCIAHGIDMSRSMHHQREAVVSGYWPLFRFDPRVAGEGAHPFKLDSHPPRLRFKDFAGQEARFAMLRRADPQRAAHLMQLAQDDIEERWRLYEQLTGLERSDPEIAEGLREDRA